MGREHVMPLHDLCLCSRLVSKKLPGFSLLYVQSVLFWEDVISLGKYFPLVSSKCLAVSLI